MYTREALPLQWAMTQNNLGNALQSLGDQGGARPPLSSLLKTRHSSIIVGILAQQPSCHAWDDSVNA